MSNANNVWPAFPCEVDPAQIEVGAHQTGNTTFAQYGMTLRDYFAAKAMPSVYADYCQSARSIGFDEQWQMGVAMDAYAMADAMLAAREVTK